MEWLYEGDPKLVKILNLNIEYGRNKHGRIYFDEFHPPKEKGTVSMIQTSVDIRRYSDTRYGMAYVAIHPRLNEFIEAVVKERVDPIKEELKVAYAMIKLEQSKTCMDKFVDWLEARITRGGAKWNG